MASTYPSTRRQSTSLRAYPLTSKVTRLSELRGYPPAPANWNIPMRRTPANDNFIKAMSPSIGGSLRKLGFGKIASQVLRLGRLNPAINTALNLYDLYNLLSDNLRPSTINTNGWTLSGTDCGGGAGINSKTPATPCGYLSSVTLANWLSGEGVIQTSGSYWSMKLYQSAQWPHPSFGFGYVGTKHASRWLKAKSLMPVPRVEHNYAPKLDFSPLPCIELALGQLVNIAPMLQPVLAPRINPVSLPYSAQPYQQNSPSPEGREAGNSPTRYPAMYFGGEASPNPPPSPDIKVDELPLVAPNIIIHDSSNPLSPAEQISLRADRHKLRRPPKRTKELKTRTTEFFYAVSPYINPLTEAVDIVNAIYKNLPEQYRPRYKDTNFEKYKLRPDEKLLAIYKHLDKIDVVGALQDIAISQAEDKAYGLSGKASGEVSRTLGKPVGTGLSKILGNLPRI